MKFVDDDDDDDEKTTQSVHCLHMRHRPSARRVYRQCNHALKRLSAAELRLGLGLALGYD